MNKELLFYYDLCGFRDYVMINGVQKAFELYAPYLTGISFSNELEKDKFNLLALSDTILLQTKQDLTDKLHNTIIVAQREAFGIWHRMIAGNSIDLPIKGAIGYNEQMFGRYDVTTQAMGRDKITAKDVQLIIGKSLIECYEWEKCQDWFCVSICPESLEDIQRDFPTEFTRLVYNKYLIEYDIPIKNGKTKRGFAINSYYYWHPVIIKEKISSIILTSKDDRIKLKYENTLHYFEYIEKMNFKLNNFPE